MQTGANSQEHASHIWQFPGWAWGRGFRECWVHWLFGSVLGQHLTVFLALHSGFTPDSARGYQRVNLGQTCARQTPSPLCHPSGPGVLSWIPSTAWSLEFWWLCSPPQKYPRGWERKRLKMGKDLLFKKLCAPRLFSSARRSISWRWDWPLQLPTGPLGAKFLPLTLAQHSHK